MADRTMLQQPDNRRPSTLFIACGALAREILALKEMTGWAELSVTCLPAHWHNHPERIAPGVRTKIRSQRRRHDRIFVLYGDCGTGGELDRVLREEGVERIPGPHCYQFFMGSAEFVRTSEQEPGCFYLTDYLARHSGRIIFKGLGLDRYPQLRDVYFGNYTRLIHITQTDDANLRRRARSTAERLGLDFEVRFRGYGELATFMQAAQGG